MMLAASPCVANPVAIAPPRPTPFMVHHINISNKNLAIANRLRVSCINTNNNTMTLKSGLEVTQGH